MKQYRGIFRFNLNITWSRYCDYVDACEDLSQISLIYNNVLLLAVIQKELNECKK